MDDTKTVIILHLFHQEMWGEFKTKLLNLRTKFDLIVTLCDEHDDITDEINKSFPDAKVFILPNRGLDIGPFLKALKYLKENELKYDYLIKLHSKKSHYNIILGKAWRKQLVDAIIGTDKILKKNISNMDSSEYKMCGAKNWTILTSVDPYTKVFEVDNLKGGKAYFVGGTIFITDYNILTESITIDDINRIYDQMNVGYVRDGSIAHYMERIFGFIIQDKGYKILGV